MLTEKIKLSPSQTSTTVNVALDTATPTVTVAVLSLIPNTGQPLTSKTEFNVYTCDIPKAPVFIAAPFI